MSNKGNSVADYDIDFSLNEKLVLRKLQKVEKALTRTNQKVVRSAQQKAKEAARVAKFEKWKVTQFRSASFAKLSLEQKMNLKRVLSSTKAEHEIREEYAKTTAFYKREAAQRTAYARKQARKSKTGVGGKGAIGAGSAAGAGGMMALAANPYVLAATAGIVGTGMAVKKGSDQFDELQAASATSGLSVQQLQQRQFVAQSVAGSEFNVDKLAQMYSDFNEKRGELLADAEFKDGELKGGGELADAMNLLIKNGVVSPTTEAINEYMSGGVADTMDKMVKDLNNNVSDVNKVRFALEAVSDLGRLNNAMQTNQDKVKAATQTYNSLNIGLTADDTNRLKEFGMAMQSLGAVITNFPLKLFSGFTESLSPETRELISRFAQALMQLAEPIGKLLGLVVDLVVKGMSPFIWALEQVASVMNPIADKIISFARVVEDAFSTLFQKVIGMLPDFMVPDSWKQKENEGTTTTNNNSTVNNNTTDNSSITNNRNTDNSTVNWDVSKPYNAQPVPTGYNPYSYTTPPPVAQTANAATAGNNVSVKNDNTTTVNVELDGNVIASTVVKNPRFSDGVGQLLHPILSN